MRLLRRRRRATALDRFWDQNPEVGSAAKAALAPDLAHGVQRLHSLGAGVDADAVFLETLHNWLFGALHIPGHEEAPGELKPTLPNRDARIPLDAWTHSRRWLGLGQRGAAALATAALVTLTLGAALILGILGSAEETAPPRLAASGGSPVADEGPVRFDECSVDAPTHETLLRGQALLTDAPLDDVPPLKRPPAGDPDLTGYDLPSGPSASDEAVEGITETLRGMTACSFDDQPPFGQGWLTGAPAGRFFAFFSPVFFQADNPGGYFGQTSLVMRGINGWRPSVPDPPILSETLQLEDGRVMAVVLDDGGVYINPTRMIVVFREVEDRWLIDAILDSAPWLDPASPTAEPMPASMLVFREAGIAPEVQGAMPEIADKPYRLLLINLTGEPRRLVITGLAADVTVEPFGHADLVVIPPAGEYEVLTYTDDQEDASWPDGCDGWPLSGGRLTVYPPEAERLGDCARG